MTTPFSLDEIADRLAIYDLYARYIHATDDHDYETLDEQVFLPDTMFDFTSVGHIKGDWKNVIRDDFIRNGKVFDCDFHLCGSIRIDFEPGHQAARVKSKTLNASGIRDAGGKVNLLQVHGGYSDVLVKTPAGWRIQSRIWNHGWTTAGHQRVEGSGGLLDSELRN
jgi:hypothetical protein